MSKDKPANEIAEIYGNLLTTVLKLYFAALRL